MNHERQCGSTDGPTWLELCFCEMAAMVAMVTSRATAGCSAVQGEGLASERGQTHRFRTRPGTSLPNADEQDKCER